MEPVAEPSKTDSFYRSGGQRRTLWVWFLILVACAYYGSYFQHGINFRDEGGTITLLAKRLYDGEVPFRDVILGYNVGWFLPIVAMFKVTGVSFVAVRVYFLVLSTIAAVLGYLTVERVGRQSGLRWGATILGVIVGLVLIAIPGMTFKNYNPLAVMANAWALVGFVFAPTMGRALGRALIGGLILGVTWLLRIDLGTFFTVLWLGVLVARLFERTWKNRVPALLGSFVLLLSGAVLTHVPVLLDAQARGYAKQFLNAYPNQWQKLLGDLDKVTGGGKKAVPAPAPAKPVATIPAPATAPAIDPATAPATPTANPGDAVAQAGTPAPPVETPLNSPTSPAPGTTQPPAPVKAVSGDTLARTTWKSVSAATGEKREDLLGLYLLTYLPLFTIIPLVLWAVVQWIGKVRRAEDSRSSLAALVLVGSALTLFAQYFFWRPDSPHLSEFGPGFWSGVVGATILLGGGFGRSWASPSRWILFFLTLHLAVWAWRMGPDRWCGTIAARANRKTWFEADNGVRIYEQAKTVEWVQEVRDQIRERTREGEYLVAYPYHPAFNLIVNRPTYEKSLYVDNATTGSRWTQDTIARIELYKPRIVIISGWSINGHASSRFKVWAAPVYQHIRSKYENFGAFGDKKKDGTLAEEDSYELFIRRKD